MESKKIGNFISQKRKEKGLTQQKLGDLLGASAKSIAKWENGITLPDYYYLDKLCQVLEINASELFNGSEEKSHLTHEESKYLFKVSWILNKQTLFFVALAFILFSIPILLFIQMLSSYTLQSICVSIGSGSLLSTAVICLISGYITFFKLLVDFLKKELNQKRK